MGAPSRPIRSDLGYLRRRTKATAVSAHAPEPSTPAPPLTSPPLTSLPPASAPPGLSLARPARSTTTAAPAPHAAPSSGASSPGLSLARGAAPAPPAPPAAPASSGLSLGRASASSTPSAPPRIAPKAAERIAPETLPFPAPSIDEIRELGEEHPVLRLNSRESAIGSLIVTGAALAVWEDRERVTGAATSGGETRGASVITSGNRPLVGFDRGEAVVSLRHVRELRRALFVARGADPIGVQIFDGSTVTVARGDQTLMFALSLVQVANLLELRAEPVARGAADAAILHQFGFELTSVVAPRQGRGR